VDDVLDADDSPLSKVLLDLRVIRDGDPLLVDLGISSLVKELPDGLEVWISIGNVWLDKSEHADGCLVESDEYSIVYLPQSQELENLPRFRMKSLCTSNPNDECQLGLWFDVEVSCSLGLSSKTNGTSFESPVFLDVLLGTLEDELPRGSSFLGNGSCVTLGFVSDFGSRLPLLQEGLGNGSLGLCLCGWSGSSGLGRSWGSGFRWSWSSGLARKTSDSENGTKEWGSYGNNETQE